MCIGGSRINNHKYADDTTLIAKAKQEMEHLLLHLTKESKTLGSEMYSNNTKLLVIETKQCTELRKN